LWRRPRPKLGCGAKERRKKELINMSILKDGITMKRLVRFITSFTK
jgi:hypothetical protein